MRKASWIWPTDVEKPDEYAQFYDEFYMAEGQGDFRLVLSADSDYVAYINGRLVAFGQYRCYPDTRVYDEIEIAEFLKTGKNTLCICVWYYGHDSMNYIKGRAGLLYEVNAGSETVAWSGEHTLCRIAPDYVGYRKKIITVQLGLSFTYDASAYNGFDRENFVPTGFHAARVKGAAGKLYPRPNKKLLLEKASPAVLVDAGRRIYDLGEEKAGILALRFKAPRGELVTVVFGEYIAEDGNLMRHYEMQDYSVELIGCGDTFEFTGYFRRIGCRYFQIIAENAEIDFIGLRETPYPITPQPFHSPSALLRRIYRTSIRTLRLCMHEHYEDCPWREQVLYPMDSRNMMLCTYYAFKEYDFARSNLWLMSKSPLSQGLLPACMPSGIYSVIPIYSLVFIMQMQEYAAASGDFSLAIQNISLMEKLLSSFAGNKDDVSGLVREFPQCWNFYEWSECLTGREEEAGSSISLPLNCFYILALMSMDKIYAALGRAEKHATEIATQRRKVFENFYDHEQRLFRSYTGRRHFAAFCNALAVLCGAAETVKENIAGAIVSEKLQKTSLAMKIFEYDALYSVDKKYRDYIVTDFARDYGYMLNRGATSFWETLEGEKLYGGAGSLCHGWSALPIVYISKFLNEEIFGVFSASPSKREKAIF